MRRRNPAARLPTALLALAVALAAAAFGSAGCGGGRPRGADTTQTSLHTSPLDSLADVVERRFDLAESESEEAGDSRRLALNAAADLVRGVLTAERPAAGWTPDALESALRERRLSAQVRELGKGAGPWVVLVADPRRGETPDLALLVFPATSTMASLAIDPFLHPFQLAAWNDTLGPALLVAGARRSPAGPQPAAWLFRLPAQPPAAADSLRFLSCAGEWGLAAAGTARVRFVASNPDSAPHLTVSNSALPNPLFEECVACPHLEADLEYRFDGQGLVADKHDLKRTPYSAFVGLVQALVGHDDEAAGGYAASRRVLDQARSLGFDRRPEGGLWRIAPGTSAASLDQTYLRGQQGAYRVLFAAGDSGFVVTSISPTTFKLD